MKLLKRIGVGLLVALFFGTSLLALIPPARANAEPAKDADIMCVPPLQELNNDLSPETGNQAGDDRAEHFKPEGSWLRIRIVNRASFEIVITPSGNCQSPSTLSMASISEHDSTGRLAALLQSIVVDGNTTDSNWNYQQRTDGNSSDDSRIDNFSDGGGLESLTEDTFGGNDAIVTNISDLSPFFRTSELFLSFDNAEVDDSVANCKDDGDDNDNFVLHRENLEMLWHCESSVGGDWTGITVGGFYTDEENFNITYFVGGSGNDTKITHVSPGERGDRTFSFCPQNGNVFRNDGCSGDLTINTTPDALAAQTTNNRIPLTITSGNESENILVSGATASSTVTAQTTIDPLAAAGPSCESEGGSFSWLLCPALELTSRFLQFVDNQVISLLSTPEEYYKNDGVSDTWGRMRNIAFIVLIPVLLIMVIGTALGFGFIDAYTIKRALPRLLIAVIFISLSLQLCQLAIDVGNAVGQGVLGLLTGSIIGVDRLSLEDLFNPSGAEGALFTGVTIVTGALAVGMIPVILLFGITAGLAIFSVFLLLAFRQMLLVGLTIISPLAILAWIFPGNDRLWKLWYNSFSKLIMLFPIIMFLIGTGKVFAYVMDLPDAPSGGTNFLETLLILVAYVGPYFLIPATFKMAGAAFANIAGMANNRSRGLFDRLRKARGQQLKNRFGDMRSGNFYKGLREDNLLNRGFQNVALTNKRFQGGMGGLIRSKGGGRYIASTRETLAKEEQKHIMEDPGFNTWAPFDDVSGISADVLKENDVGIRRQLMKRGIGVKKKTVDKVDEQGNAVLDANGNAVQVETDEVEYDKDGNFQVTDKVALDAAFNRVWNKVKAGDRDGAVRQGLIEMGTFKEGDAGLDTNVGHFSAARRKFTDDALAQALVKKAAAGGTYYDSNEDVWLAAQLATAHDGAANAEMASSLRGILINAGRADTGGGAFGATGKYMKAIAAATSDDERKRLTKEYTKHVIDNTPASTLFHAQMKENYNERNIVPLLQERLEQDAAAAEGKSEDSREFDTYMSTLAEVDNIHQMSLATKPAFAKKIAKHLMSKKLPNPITRDVEVPIGVRTIEEEVEVPVNARPMVESKQVPVNIRPITENIQVAYTPRAVQRPVEVPNGLLGPDGRTPLTTTEMRTIYLDDAGSEVQADANGQPPQLTRTEARIRYVDEAGNAVPTDNLGNPVPTTRTETTTRYVDDDGNDVPTNANGDPIPITRTEKRTRYQDENGNDLATGPNGLPVNAPTRIERKVVATTVRDANQLFRTNRIYQNHHKEFYGAEEEGATRAQAAAFGQNPGPGQAPGGPIQRPPAPGPG